MSQLKINKRAIVSVALIFFCHPIIFGKDYYVSKEPHLIVIFVIDQLSHHLMQKLEPYFQDGLKILSEQGVNYTNAFYPHAMPATATGHTALNTGTFASKHGIIANTWFENGREVACDDDEDLKSSAVFAKRGEYEYGKSAKKIKVDGLSDQYMMQSDPIHRRHVYGLSLKSRAAIAMAGKLGKALWFDVETGWFTSSKAYFNQLPAWVDTFNSKKKIDRIRKICWRLRYARQSDAYKFDFLDDYDYAAKENFIGDTHTIDYNEEKPFETFCATPYGNKILLDFAQSCIETTLKDNNDTLLLWISLSSLDKISHFFGPYSLEALDMMYHLDKQMLSFIQYAQKMVGRKNTLFVLTADHGSMPILGKIANRGYPDTHILKFKDVIQEMNFELKNSYGTSNLVHHYEAPQFYLDQKVIDALDGNKREAILDDLKKFLEKKPGIKTVWSSYDLDTKVFKKDEYGYFFQKQRYPGRSGDLFVLLDPYTLLTKYIHGTSHETPYNYDTHVPLYIYQKGIFKKKKITEKVWPLQLANTLAEILNIPRPSASTCDILPGLLK